MIIRYASDEDNDTTNDGQNVLIISKKGKIETNDISEDYVKENKMFAYDFFENSSSRTSGNESDAQFLQKFEYLKINDADNNRFYDKQYLLSNQIISKRENQFINKEVLTVLNASLDIKNKNLNRTKNNKSNTNNIQSSFNEISSIAQGNSNTEFSQTDFSIAMDNKEREMLNKCMDSKDSQTYFKNDIPGNKQIINYAQGEKKPKNQKNFYHNKDGDRTTNSDKANEEAESDNKNSAEQQEIEIKNESNVDNQTYEIISASSCSNKNNTTYNINNNPSNYNFVAHTTQNEIYNQNNNVNNNNNNDNHFNIYQNMNERIEKQNSKKIRKSKKDMMKFERENQNRTNEANQNTQINLENLSKAQNQQNLNFRSSQNSLNYQKSLSNNNNNNNNNNYMFNNQNQNSFSTNNNNNNNYFKYKDGFHPQIMQNNMQPSFPKNNNSNNNMNINRNFNNDSQMFVNPCYVYKQNFNGQRVPFALNMPFNHQIQSRNIPYNMMNNGNYYFYYPNEINRSSINHSNSQAMSHGDNLNLNQNSSYVEQSNRKFQNPNQNQINSLQSNIQKRPQISSNSSIESENQHQEEQVRKNHKKTDASFSKKQTAAITAKGKKFNNFYKEGSEEDSSSENPDTNQLQINYSMRSNLNNNYNYSNQTYCNSNLNNFCESKNTRESNNININNNYNNNYNNNSSFAETQSLRSSNELNHNYHHLTEAKENKHELSNNDFYADSTCFTMQSNRDCLEMQDKNLNLSNGVFDPKRFNNKNNNKLRNEVYYSNNKTREANKDSSLMYQRNYCCQNENVSDFNNNSRNNINNNDYSNKKRNSFTVNNNNNNSKKYEKAIAEESCDEEEEEVEYDECEENEHINALISKKKFSDLSEKDLLNSLLLIAKDQLGCRFLQQKIDENPNFACFELYSEIQSNIKEFICDIYGNYLVQKMLDALTTDKINQLVSKLTPNLYFYATHLHATRIIQKLLDIIQSNKQIQTSEFFSKIKNHSLDLFKDINGIHVIQKIIKNISALKDLIFDIAEENLVGIATNKHGCCALQKCLELADKTHKNSLIENIIKNSIILMTDQFGNYVIQFVISLKEQSYIRAIISTFKDNIEYLSKQKYASNVIEKCFDNCSEENKSAIVWQLAKPNIISELIVNNFGNFVLQKAMKNSKEPFFSIFITVIGQNLHKLKKFQWGPKLYNKILDNFTELKAYVPKPKQKC